ncbi:MAG: ATP-binding cassette domain-containing protein [Coprococcus sp.]|nr:ATP-binding cassette domain-containing protein [Coprococcus sp.]
MAQIIFDHVTKKFKDEVALDDVSFEINKGEFVFITGKSGAGKSTLLNLIMKQEEVTSGKITVNGHRVDIMKRRRIPAHRRRLGVMSPEVGLLKDRTVYDNIMFAILATGKMDERMKKTIMGTLGLVGLVGKFQAFPNELSGGEKARVLLARALSVRPEILIADEPTANLDGDSAWDLMQLLAEVNYRGMTVLVASHARELVTIMRRRCMTLVAGTLVADEKNAIYNLKATDVFEERRVLEKSGKKKAEKC